MVLLGAVLCALAVAFPLVFVAVGFVIGMQSERRAVVHYLRQLDDELQTRHLATRIGARAHRDLEPNVRR